VSLIALSNPVLVYPVHFRTSFGYLCRPFTSVRPAVVGVIWIADILICGWLPAHATLLLWVVVATCSVITFCVSRRRRKMYCGHARLSVCLSVCVSVCLSAAVCPHYCTDLGVTWGSGRGWLLVVHYWADLQSVRGLRCYSNITRTPVTSLRPSRYMTT